MRQPHTCIEPGRDLLHYRILEKIGEGGMGVVWKAIDSDLNREVAIKLLPERVAVDPERLGRFEREARLLATLNHPNIAAVYGLHETDGERFIAMELIAGEDLSDRLARGPMPIDQAVTIAAQIAEALETAHEQGVIHRDLKPANVRLTPDGRAKVLDFGLAKALDADRMDSLPSLSLSPTMTAGTMAGVLLGTAAYMSPQQARGESVDQRADIWAFGCLLLEMLTGKRVFEGSTVSDTLAAVLRAEPDLGAMPAETPRHIRSLISRCLDKDERSRLRDIGEARIALRTEPDDESPTAPASSSRRWLGATIAMVTLLIGGFVGWFSRPLPDPPHERKLSLAAPVGIEGNRTLPRIAPDGRAMAYVAAGQLWVQDLDSLIPRPIVGAEGVTHVEWSPDGQALVYAVRSKLWRTRPSGESLLIADLPNAIGAGGGLAWLDDDRIVYSTGDDNLYVVPISGGRPEVLLAPRRPDEVDFHEPSALPGGGVLFILHKQNGDIDTLLAFVDGERRAIHSQEGAEFWRASYSPTGHLIYALSGSSSGLWAVPFSLKKLETTGGAFRITEQGSDISASGDHSLLYSNISSSGVHQMTFVDREGTILEGFGDPVPHADNVTFSPDRSKLAVCLVDFPSDSIWIYDLERGSSSRISSTGNCGGSRGQSAWTPDGESLAFGDVSIGKIRLLKVDGSNEELMVTEGQQPTFTSDGKHMVYVTLADNGEEDLSYLELENAATPQLLVTDPGRDQTPQMSPSGRLLAYVADHGSGRTEIYLQTFPEKTGAWQVSSNGGSYPRWSPDGNRLYYLEDEVVLMVVDIATEPTVRLNNPKEVFKGDDLGLVWNHGWDVFSDDRFFTIESSTATAGAGDLTLITDWAF